MSKHNRRKGGAHNIPNIPEFPPAPADNGAQKTNRRVWLSRVCDNLTVPHLAEQDKIIEEMESEGYNYYEERSLGHAQVKLRFYRDE